jgi:hypothetical protein
MVDIHPGIVAQNRQEFQKRPRIGEITDRYLNNTPMFRRNLYQYLKGNAFAKWITTVMFTGLLIL